MFKIKLVFNTIYLHPGPKLININNNLIKY